MKTKNGIGLLLILAALFACDLDNGPEPTTPSLSTTPVYEITFNAARSGGEVVSDGMSPVLARGIVWAEKSDPSLDGENVDFTLDGSGLGKFESAMTGINPNSSYTVRAYATNSVGTAYGQPQSFLTPGGLSESDGQPCPDAPTVTDVDGNVYQTIQINDQCWMKSNLKASHYRNGEPIPTGHENEVWDQLTGGAYAVYYNPFVDLSPAEMKSAYGLLYNWYAAVDNRHICPEGWRLPGDDDWNALTNYIIGMVSHGGRHLKSCRQVNAPAGGDCNTSTHPRWRAYDQEDTDGTDLYGFSGLPAGSRGADPIGFNSLGVHIGFWLADERSSDPTYARTRYLSYGPAVIQSNVKKHVGLSIRCIKE